MAYPHKNNVRVVEVDISSMIKTRPFVNVHYLSGVLSGTGCRWALVYGYNHSTFESSKCDCVEFVTKPTKKQIRQYMKEARNWIARDNGERAWEDVIIDVLGWDVQ